MSTLSRIAQARRGNCPRTYNFGGPSAPKISPPTPAPPPPTVDQAVQSSKTAEDLRRRRGAASNILAGSDQQTPTTGIVKLLGA